LSAQPRYWGTWKGQVIKAISVDGARTWQDIFDITGLSEYSLNTALSEMYNAGILEKREESYRVTYDLYREYRDYFWKNDRKFGKKEVHYKKSPIEVQLVCPYCKKQQTINFNENISSEFQCENKYCTYEWHKP
jgi:hypothetical protein